MQSMLSMRLKVLSACALYDFCWKYIKASVDGYKIIFFVQFLPTQIGFKGSLTRDIRLQVFFVNQCSPGPWVCHLDCFDFFTKIRGENREWMLVSGVNDTSDKRGDKLGPKILMFEPLLDQTPELRVMLGYGPAQESHKKTKQTFFSLICNKKTTLLLYSQSKINLCCNILYCIFILCLLLNFIQANNFSHSNSQYLINYLSFCSNGIFFSRYLLFFSSALLISPPYPHVLQIYICSLIFPAHSFFICSCFSLFLYSTITSSAKH